MREWEWCRTSSARVGTGVGTVERDAVFCELRAPLSLSLKHEEPRTRKEGSLIIVVGYIIHPRAALRCYSMPVLSIRSIARSV